MPAELAPISASGHKRPSKRARPRVRSTYDMSQRDHRASAMASQI